MRKLILAPKARHRKSVLVIMGLINDRVQCIVYCFDCACHLSHVIRRLGDCMSLHGGGSESELVTCRIAVERIPNVV